MMMVLLTITCGPMDADAIATSLRDALARPIHQRAETVVGLDFEDAGTVERVAGSLSRTVIEVELSAELVPNALEIVTTTRRRLPFRWRTTAVLDGGRIV